MSEINTFCTFPEKLQNAYKLFLFLHPPMAFCRTISSPRSCTSLNCFSCDCNSSINLCKIHYKNYQIISTWMDNIVWSESGANTVKQKDNKPKPKAAAVMPYLKKPVSMSNSCVKMKIVVQCHKQEIPPKYTYMKQEPIRDALRTSKSSTRPVPSTLLMLLKTLTLHTKANIIHQI